MTRTRLPHMPKRNYRLVATTLAYRRLAEFARLHRVKCQKDPSKTTETIYVKMDRHGGGFRRYRISTHHQGKNFKPNIIDVIIPEAPTTAKLLRVLQPFLDDLHHWAIANFPNQTEGV